MGLPADRPAWDEIDDRCIELCRQAVDASRAIQPLPYGGEERAKATENYVQLLE
jgi:hypothetical protein